MDTVSYDEISEEYSYIKKVKEKYTEHSRTVTKTRTNSDGETETYTETEYYWTWDEVQKWEKCSKKIEFLDMEFKYGAIKFPSYNQIKIINESYYIRHVYYAAPAKCQGTLYANLKDNTIYDVRFYYNSDIDNTIKTLSSSVSIWFFWIIWIMLTGGLVFGFYYIDNRWLEEK